MKNLIGLDKEKTLVLRDKLNDLLADYQLFYQNLRGLHWNIKGKEFFELHVKFEEFYNDAIIKIDDFSIDQTENGEIIIINLPDKKCSTQNILANPQDGQLNLLINNGGKKYGLLSVQTMELENDREEKLILDESVAIDTPAQIGIGDHQISLIVGKKREFNIN